MGTHTETRYHVHGQTQPDDAGKRSAVKAARYVWRGAFGKVPSVDGNSPGAYPTRKMVRLCERRVGYDRLVGEHAYRNSANSTGRCVSTSTAAEPSMKLLAKQRDGKKARYVYDPAKTPLQRLLLSGVLPANKQQELTEVAQALDPIGLLHQLEQLQQAVFLCAAGCAPFLSSPLSDPLHVFSVEQCTAGKLAEERKAPAPTAGLEALYREQERRKRVHCFRRTYKDPDDGRMGADLLLASGQSRTEQRRHFPRVAVPLSRTLSALTNPHAAARDTQDPSLSTENQAGAVAGRSDRRTIVPASLRGREAHRQFLTAS